MDLRATIPCRASVLLVLGERSLLPKCRDFADEEGMLLIAATFEAARRVATRLRPTLIVVAESLNPWVRAAALAIAEDTAAQLVSVADGADAYGVFEALSVAVLSAAA
jgi:hypothetical protein